MDSSVDCYIFPEVDSVEFQEGEWSRYALEQQVEELDLTCMEQSLIWNHILLILFELPPYLDDEYQNVRALVVQS